MDSSSEGSFAWTDASDDSTDSDNMAKAKMSAGQSEEESESGQGYKKKLQQRLFSERAQHEPAPAARKRKLQPEPAHTQSKKIKLEPESDIDCGKKKRKKLSESSYLDSTHERYEESFLESKVTSEKSFMAPAVAKSKKKKKKSVSDTDYSTTNNGVDNTSDSQILPDVNGILERSGCNDTLAFDSSIQEERENEYDLNTKKKKKKKKSHQRSPKLEQDEVEKDLSGQNSSQAMDTVDETPTYTSAAEPAESQPTSETPSGATTLNGDHTPHDRHSQSSFQKRKPKMSERIRFENDEEDSDVQVKRLGSTQKPEGSGDKKLRNYMGSHGYLRRSAAGAPAPGPDDDVWLLHVPRAVPPAALRGARLAPGAACRLKLAGHTYEVAPAAAPHAVLAAPGARLRRLAPAARLRLQRRLPAPRAPEAAAPSRAAFIPLPDTKSRHPLLGAHYKKALRAAAATVRRPRARSASPDLALKKKKKRKRAEEASPAAPPAWDSAKAIEQNLFNF